MYVCVCVCLQEMWCVWWSGVEEVKVGMWLEVFVNGGCGVGSVDAEQRVKFFIVASSHK